MSGQETVTADGYRWLRGGPGTGDGLGPDPHEAVMEPVLRDLLGDGVLLDVGAHVGHWTVRLAGQASRVIAIEANPATAATLRANLELNGITNAEVHNVAAWDSRAMLRLQDPNGQERGGSTRVLPADKSGPGTAEAVPLDELLAREPRIDLVKLDVEGADLHALRGMAGTLARCRPVLFIERHDQYGYYRAQELFDLLASLGYGWRPAPCYGGASYLIAAPGGSRKGTDMASQAGEIYIARQGAVLNLDGQVTYISPGMTARAGHPVLGQAPGLFEPLTVDFEYEQPPEPEASEKPPAQKPAAKPDSQPAKAAARKPAQ